MDDTTHARAAIIDELAVRADFDPAEEIERRTRFLADTVRSAGATGLVLGISGGVDSSAVGRLCQLAVECLRGEGNTATFVAMRLPYGVQRDERDARQALDFIRPDEVLTVNVRPASDALLEATQEGGLRFADAGDQDFVLGNVKARQRMIAQYTVAGARNMLVAGTDHAAEAVMGFFTKYGDGACDLTPLTGLTKRRVRALTEHLGADERLVHKVATADLETNSPGLPDEQAFGISYDDIDDFLEGKQVSEFVQDTVVSWHRRTAHKRTVPTAP